MVSETAMEFQDQIKQAAHTATLELIEAAGLRRGEILVVGCSSSEIMGDQIGQSSSPACAELVFDEIYGILRGKGIFLAAQCCEHLNRALIIERACAEQYGLEEVCVIPQPKAGGSFATAAWNGLSSPVAVEYVKAHAGLDIGGTLIGMHLRCVAVPVRLSVNCVGKARLLAARTRPKYIGGSRAQYE